MPTTWALSIAPLLTGLAPKTAATESRLRHAFTRAGELYGNRTHWTGVSLLEHTIGVLHMLMPFQPDMDTMVACVLQHALETKTMTTLELQEEFGPQVRALVSGAHLLSRIHATSRQKSIEDLRLMLLSVADDIRILLIVLCRRCFSLEHCAQLAPSERKYMARDALNLFAPVAARLGIHTLKQRLEALAFPVVYPSDAERIKEQMDEVHERYGIFLDDAAKALEKALRAEGVRASVLGREKQLYSIFLKMRSKSLTHVESLPDLFALRVIVEKQEECYSVLGALHHIGRPVTTRFKDYIAFPKPNGYQSLHTTVANLPVAPENVFLEVQIRTRSMHREAEYGVAAHWSYKEGGTARQTIQRVHLQQALASQHTLEGTDDSPARLVDHIFVLTPKGDFIELPEGATPLDFAFQIHTDVGLSFRSARVNGAIVPLDYELENGDMVEIVTQRTPHASAEWLQLLKMASSRSRLKRYLHTQHRVRDLATGRDMLGEELRRRKLPTLDTNLSLLRKHDGKALTILEREDLLVKLGQGTDKVGSLIQRLDLLKPLRMAEPPAPKRGRIRMQRKDSLIEIDADVPMPMKFAKCCKPSVDERKKIVGIITRTGDVTVHEVECHNAQRGNPERRVGVRWR